MTTEIAVANRLGIALASDSAVTITGGGRVKIFDTADKLFELSLRHPVGVMINGNMDCLGVPWEVLVKDFREVQGDTKRTTIGEWMKDFLSYVETHSMIGNGATERHALHIIDNEIQELQNNIGPRIREEIGRRSLRTKDAILTLLTELFLEQVSQRTEFLRLYPIADSLVDLSFDEVTKAYSEIIDKRVVERFSGQKLSLEELSAFRAMVIEAFIRAYPSDHVAGLVVAGFGCGDTFPSIQSVEVDGRIFGKMKSTQIDNKSIVASSDGGQVTYFAQTDVIQRLLEGADPEFIETTADFIEKAVRSVADTLESALRPKRLSKRKVADRQSLIREIVSVVRTEYEEETAENLKKQFSRQFDRMIAMMPKQELIELAEALVSITAVERKATADEGTVGGLIDVAFITKHEGFVWVKRKHYFEKDLNPTYFWRRYQNTSVGSAS